MSESLAFVEAFGPTIQGEGPQSGQASSFVRFGACNLSCDWCDSAYTWDTHRYNLREEVVQLRWQEVLDRIPTGPTVLVITGGEPLLQQNRGEAWTNFLAGARERFAFLAMETNGTQKPSEATTQLIDQFVVSPKLSTVRMLRERQDRRPVPFWSTVQRMTAVDFKIVVSTPDDVAEALAIADLAGIPRHKLWLMPEGVTTAELAERWPWVTEAAAQHGCNASHRLHVLSWGEERGH